MSKNFVNFHVIISHSPSCLNRDDMNMQKTAIFGGKRRVRISSQSLKRTLRTSAYYKQHFGEPSRRTLRLLDLRDEVVTKLADRYDETLIDRVLTMLSEKPLEKKTAEAEFKKVVDELAWYCEQVKKADIKNAKDLKKLCSDKKYKDHFGEPSIPTLRSPELESKFLASLSIDYDEKLIRKVLEMLSDKEFAIAGDAVMPWAAEEVAWYCEQLKLAEKDGPIDVKAFAKKLEKSGTGLHQAIGSALDIALSGRMATSGLMSELGKVDGALAVAHAITTHEVSESDLDWFTAVDDLQALGSGHLNTQEFSAGVFYRYASLNLAQLQENLGGVSRERALEIAAHVLHMLATEVPGAKQLSFAANNLADLAMVSLSDLPISLANAFEAPVKEKGKGYLAPSIEYFHDYWTDIQDGYGLNDQCAEFLSRKNADSPSALKRCNSLSALEQWLARDGKD